MTRAAVCGAELRPAAELLRLSDAGAPQVVLVDTRDAEAVAAAARHSAAIPRVVVADPERVELLRACGVARIARTCEAHMIGPLVAEAVPPDRRGATSTVVFTAARGGLGRTLLVTNVARRLAPSRPLWLVDATGSGAAAWWLRGDARPWSELEPLVAELTIEHLRVVATEPAPGIRVLGGAGDMPSEPVLSAVTARARDAGELVLIDAPPLGDARARRSPGGRRLVLAYDEPVSLAMLAACDPADDWIVASQCPRIGGHDALRSLPRDVRAVAAALARHAPVGGALGRAYDEVAELVAIDTT